MIEKLEKLNRPRKIAKDKKLCYYFLIFIICAFAGWIYEELYYLLDDKILVNRGFLYGPYLPIYGFGALMMVILLKKYKKRPVLFFVLAMVAAGVLEYLSGFLILKIYNTRFWDYRGLFLNISGFVCLRSLLSFATGGLLLIYIAEPLILKLVNKTSIKKLKNITVILFTIIIIDCILTIIFRYPLW